MDHLKEITLKPFNSYVMTLLNVGFILNPKGNVK